MNRITHTTRGLDQLRHRLAALPAAAEMAVATALSEVADGAAEEVRRALRGGDDPGSGAASRPGAPPADPKGRLAAAVTLVRHPGRPGAAVTVDLPFARDLEFGTARMAPRPFLRPAMLRAGHNAGAALGAAMRGALAALKGASR